MTDTKNDSASRWQAAEALADGVTDDGLHKRRARILLQIVALIAGSWIVGFVVAIIFLPKGGSGGGSGGGGGSSDAQVITQLAFVVLGLIVGIVGFVWAKRTGHYITRWRAVASPLNRQEKKSVRRQISGKDQPDHEHLRVVVAIANQNRRATLGIAPLYFAIVLFAIATAVGSNVLYIKLLELLVSLLFVVTAVQLTVQYRRAGRFIEKNSGTDA